jgi:hypothetical protein
MARPLPFHPAGPSALDEPLAATAVPHRELVDLAVRQATASVLLARNNLRAAEETLREAERVLNTAEQERSAAAAFVRSISSGRP